MTDMTTDTEREDIMSGVVDEAMTVVMGIANKYDEVETDVMAYELALSLLGFVFISNGHQMTDVLDMLNSDIQYLQDCQQAGTVPVQ